MQEQQTFTFEQKVNILQNLALFPALTIMVFLRRKLGFRFINMLKIQFMAVLLIAYGAFSSITSGPSVGGVLFLFSIAMLIMAFIGRRLRWHDITHGVSWHTYSRGISWFNSFLPLPEIIVRRFIDPAAALIIGGVFYFLFRPLGLYILLSAVCLFIFETIDYQRQIDSMLDMHDSLVDSEVHSANVEYFQSGQADTGTARSVEETAGIPTGVSPDLAAAIARRQAKQPRSAQLPPQPVTGPPPAQQPGGVSPVRDSDSIGASLPPYPQGYPPQEPSPNSSRRRAVLTDNLVITDSSQPGSLPGQGISMQPSPSQQAASLQAVPPQAQSIQKQQKIPVIKSPDDPAFAALPSGAQFVTPDGKTRWKK